MKHGCNGRPPLKDTMLVQDGYWSEPGPELFTRMTRHRVIEIKVQTSKHCQYVLDNPTDPGCAGCPNNNTPEPEGGQHGKED